MKMKKLLLLPLLAPLAAFAQTGSHLTVMPAIVQPGKTVTLTYDPAGTKLEKEKDIKGTLFLINKKQSYVADDINFKPSGGLWKAEVTIPDTIVLAGIKVYSGKLTDNNDEKGYLLRVTDAAGKPVAGQLAAEAYVRQMGGGIIGAKNDEKEAQRLYEAEMTAYPASRSGLLYLYSMVLKSNKQTEKLGALQKEMLARFQNAKATETDLGDAALVFYSGNRPVYDSLNKVIQQRFPMGSAARSVASMPISREADPAKKEELYKAFVAKYNPPASLKNAMLTNIASSYASKKNFEKFNELIAQVTDKSNLPGTFNSIAWPLAEKGENLDFAASISKQSLDIVEGYKTTPPAYYKSYAPSERANVITSTWGQYADTYALILYKQGKYADALAYQEKAVTPSSDAEMKERLVTFLNANGKHKEAMAKTEEYMKDGKSTAKMREELKTAYIKVKRSESGYDAYAANLQAVAEAKVRAEITSQMINQKATLFALKDTEGKEVSLASLKGKVVIVDFWATWCGPCKASFPAMQKMVTKYKDNPNVVFLFVDTWETDPKRESLVTKFIADNNYSFRVLYDTEKKDQKGKYDVVEQFGVEGIPTKFVVDKNGVIRFKSVGFGGSDDALVSELSTMIEIANNPPAQITKSAEE